MVECVCNENFRTAEDYRDHLPCRSPEDNRIIEILRDLRKITYQAGDWRHDMELALERHIRNPRG